MDDIQKHLQEVEEEHLARLLKAEKKAKKRMEKGKKRSEQIIKSGSERGQEILESGRERGKEILGATGAGADQLIPEKQIEAGREFYKEQIADKKAEGGKDTSETGLPRGEYAKTIPGGYPTVKQPKLLTDEEKQAFGERTESAGSVKGSWNRLQARLSAMRKLQQESAMALTDTKVLNTAAQQAVKNVWYAIHEAVEGLVYASWFILSPLAVALVFIRIIGYLGLNHFFSIRFRGIEVKPFPAPGWGDISRVKTILACIVTLIMILIIYILTNPCKSIGSVFGEGAAKVFSSACSLFGLH